MPAAIGYDAPDDVAAANDAAPLVAAAAVTAGAAIDRGRERLLTTLAASPALHTRTAVVERAAVGVPTAAERGWAHRRANLRAGQPTR